MNTLEQQLLSETVGDVKPRLSLRTGTRIDTGRWGRRSPSWLCLMEDELVILAVGRRRHVERIPLAEAAGSFFDPGSGQLVIAPCESLRFNSFKMPAPQALQMLDLLNPTLQSPTTDS